MSGGRLDLLSFPHPRPANQQNDFATISAHWDETRQGIIGKPLDRPEAALKVTGTATYAAEYRPENCAEGVLVTAKIAQGKVLRLHDDQIRSMPGVLGVFADKLMLRRPAQGTAGQAPVQNVGEVEYYCQPVALVVAETFEQARHAAHTLRIDYESAPKVPLDPESSEYHPARKPVVLGDLEEAMAQAAHCVDLTYATEGHASAAMEPHASIAEWQGNELTLWGSFQMISHNVKELADSLRISPRNVRIVSPYVGGGFGSKLGISHDAIAAAIAARGLGRPVRVVLTRQQVFATIMRRSETRQRLRLAADTNGRLTGLGHEAWVSNLPDEKLAEPVTQATEFLYGGANRKLVVNIARISRLTSGSVRAPGEAVGMQVREAAMDELAEKAGIDPVELRKRNLPASQPGKDRPYSSRMLVEALDQGARAFGWENRKPRPCMSRDGEWWVGMGVASAARVNMLMPAAARVRLEADGSLLVQSDQTDIGTGSYAILGQIAGEMLGVPIAQVRVELGESQLPLGAGSGGSFGACSIPEASTQKIQPKLVTEHRDGGNEGGTPGAMLSAGNLNTAALTLFIALHLCVPNELPWMILDDPVQSMDDVHIAHFSALLRTLSKEHGRQVMIAVHDRQLFEYLKLELSPAFPEDSLLTLELSRGPRRDSVCISRRFAFKEETAIHSAA
ncbi:molybdopterin cofactor-binding domain-containing protein [Paracoccus sp. KR1-242]